MVPRLDQSFPTRIYPYRKTADGPAGIVAQEKPELLSEGVFQFRLGRDPRLISMSAAQISELGDPFARLLLSRNVFPLSLRKLLSDLDERNSDPSGLPDQRSFLVADGGKIPWTPETAALRREFRFVVTRAARGASQPDLLIAASTNLDSETIFLQLIAWDSVHEAYQFYQRLGHGWAWAGSSWDALANDTRGKGPFDSHVNGALVMKELKFPWVNWHSMAASITRDALAPGDPLPTESLYQQRGGADKLEMDVVRPGVKRWNEARFRSLFQNGVLKRANEFLRQILFTTTVNLTSAPEERTQVRPGVPIHLPLSFFINNDALLDTLHILEAVQRPQVDGGIYAQCLQRYDVSISDGESKLPGDTHFVFVVPEPAFEDLVVFQKLLTLKLMSAKLAASLIMVDFQNPVFSERRAVLARHMPNEIRLTDSGSDLADQILRSISASSVSPNSPEAEFLENWNVSETEWTNVFAARIEDYIGKVEKALQNLAGFDQFFRLAESRRREFRKRPLAEFRLTTPLTNIPENVPLLEMTTLGTVQNKSNPEP
jgi:hypothetical protein